MMLKKEVWIGALLCLIASMSWGAMFPVAHVALQIIDPFYFSFIRYAIVGLILTIILYFKEGRSSFKLEGKGMLLVILGTMAFVVYNMCVFLGQQMMGTAGTVVASIMEVLMPSITVLILWLTTRKKPAKAALRNIIIAFIGAILVISRGELSFFNMGGQQLIPILFIFAGVVGWVIYSLGGARFNGWSVLRYSTLTCLLGSAVSFIIVIAATMMGWISVPTIAELSAVKLHMAFMIVVPGLIALLSWNKGLQLLSSTHGVLFINFVPITTFVIIAIQGYSINYFEIIGTVLIIAALIHNTLGDSFNFNFIRNRLHSHILHRLPSVKTKKAYRPSAK